ncbi:hypothetical protein [Chrysiogenes arsenatis]|uniref:hypothetical protein n=1 Tax=Chrysiogenes arsenatis TaxID=309797 RepID=UPI000416979D|nr:hypothetical protein [Chrysiogenes arsenatis]
MNLEPLFCPYCGAEGSLEEMETSAMEIDGDLWLIYHWYCEQCQEQFDKVELSPLSIDDSDDDDLFDDDDDMER